MKTKVCPECKKERTAIHFSIDRNKPDGMARICRDCCSEYQHRRRLVQKFSGEIQERLHSYLPPTMV